MAVKEGLGRGSAISLSAQAARQRIRQGIAAAVTQHRQKPDCPPDSGPGRICWRNASSHTDTADAEMSKAGAERVDAQRVRFRSDNILDIVYR